MTNYMIKKNIKIHLRIKKSKFIKIKKKQIKDHKDKEMDLFLYKILKIRTNYLILTLKIEYL